CLRVQRINRLGGVAGDLSKRRGVRREHGDAARHRLDDRQSEPFVERREREEVGKVVDCRQVLEWQITGEMDRALDAEPFDVAGWMPGRPSVRSALTVFGSIAGAA